MNKSFLLLLLFIPFSASAGIYQDIAGAYQMISDGFTSLFDFLFSDIPDLFQRATAYFIVWSTKAKIYGYLSMMKFSWGVAEIIIQDLNIMSLITSQMSLLPQDVRQAFVHMRLFDGINLLFNAYMTKFVMNFIK